MRAISAESFPYRHSRGAVFSISRMATICSHTLAPRGHQQRRIRHTRRLTMGRRALSLSLAALAIHTVDHEGDLTPPID